MSSKNELATRIISGLVIALMVVIVTLGARGNSRLAQVVTNHKDADAPHAGIAVNNARFEMIERQLADILKLMRASP